MFTEPERYSMAGKKDDKDRKPDQGEDARTDDERSSSGKGLEFDTALKRVLDSARSESDGGDDGTDQRGETVFQPMVELPESSAESGEEDTDETQVLKPIEDDDGDDQGTRVLKPIVQDAEDDSGTRVLNPIDAGSVRPSEEAEEAPAEEPESDSEAEEDAGTRVLQPLDSEHHPDDDSDDNATRVGQPLPDAPEPPDASGETVFQPIVELNDDQPEAEPRPKSRPKLPPIAGDTPTAGKGEDRNTAMRPAARVDPPEPAGSTQVMTVPPGGGDGPPASTQVMSSADLPSTEDDSGEPTRPSGRPPWAVVASVGLVVVVAGLLAILQPWQEASDSPSEGGSADAEANPDNDLMRRYNDTLTEAIELDSRLTAVLADARTTREELLEIEARFEDASEDEAMVLRERRDRLFEDSSRLIEKASLIRDHVMNDVELDAIQTLSSQIEEVDSETERQALAARLQSIQAGLQSADLQFREMERALDSRQGYRSVVSEWKSYGFDWPVSDADRERLPEMALSLDELVHPGDRAADLLAAGRFSEAEAVWRESAGGLRQLIDQASGEAALGTARILTLLTAAELAIEEYHLTSPEDDNAFDYYRSVLELDPSNAQARDGLMDVVAAYALLLDSALRGNDLEAAEGFLASARTVAELAGDPAADQVDVMARRIDSLRGERRQTQLRQLMADVERAESAGDLGLLESLFARAESLGASAEDRQAIRDAMATVAVLPGRRFSDELGQGGSGPELVVLPTGRFTMGEDGGGLLRRLGSSRNEQPAHEVIIESPIALSRTEITVDTFRRFVEATGYRTDAERSGAVVAMTGDGEGPVKGLTWSRDFLGRTADGGLPVINVSWVDAQAYVDWLSESTGHRYRLPSESEFEFALRAGREGRYLWGGDDPPAGVANLNGQDDPAPSGWDRRPSARGDLRRYADGHFGPASVASFPANAWGLHDLLGNVAEWTGDCYIDDYEGKGTDPVARVAASCNDRVIRGSDWAGETASLRLSHRRAGGQNTAFNRVGFRVVRTLADGE